MGPNMSSEGLIASMVCYFHVSSEDLMILPPMIPNRRAQTCRNNTRYKLFQVYVRRVT